jgi:hypothetical protein
MRLFRDALRRLGAASLMLLPTACGVRSGPPAPVVLAVPPAGHYAAAPASAYAPPPVAAVPSRPYPAT